MYSHGQDPDPRFSLANERTFLSWVRTSLALIAAGVALEALDVPAHPTARIIVSVIFLVLGGLIPVYAWLTWAYNERSLRTDRPLAGPRIGPLLAVALGVSAVVLAVGLFVG
ncbi:protein of unknown function DUF202 [Jonesia denitrificans DSM 20603]|uniref:DUF202 domain-containing protein n=1 Tax=Jonesia denitrificans (strain ATCC 14870 / DSM 20603 / BCRC 15368 / CIP 55.134 / JCM 11481 / NBRC 15587 / NCTC 10816 / Prevot 55134) TaxID=471856 RepID=C7QZP6_JONDD|nr:protein of unknown function DUF202 [Jonesia denitrificans DSM 20603]SQH20029.1 Inner membrane protein yidH [Jonesia denitrificans]